MERKVYQNIIKLPAGLGLLYGVQVFITFGFAVLYSSLAFYFTDALHLSQAKSSSLIGLFIAASFGLRLVSGYLAGHFLSKRTLFLICTVLQLVGVFLLSVGDEKCLYIALGAFLIGCGMDVTCLQCILTEKFDAHDDKGREAAFFMNYVASNTGFLLGFSCSGYFELQHNYASLFCVCLLTSLVSLAIFLKGWKHFEDRFYEGKKKISWLRKYMGMSIILLCLPLLYLAFHYAEFSNNLIVFSSFFMLLFVGYMAYKQPEGKEKSNLWAFLILTLFSLVFWALYYVGPMGFAWFLKYNTNNWLFGVQIPPQWIMNLNSIFVILGSPLCLLVIHNLRSKGLIVSVAKQFWLSILFIALSFFVLSLGIYSANAVGLSSMVWIVLHFLFQAIGELLIAPVGYAMIGKLISPKFQSIMMGTWMMVAGISATIARHFSVLMTRTESLDPLISNANYAINFNLLGFYGFIAAIFLYFLIPVLEKIMDGKDEAITAVQFS